MALLLRFLFATLFDSIRAWKRRVYQVLFTESTRIEDENDTCELESQTKRGKKASRIEETPARRDDENGEMMTYVGVVDSPFVEKFGTPRQGIFVKDTRCVVRFFTRVVDAKSSLEGLERFQHCWLIFSFNANKNREKHLQKQTSRSSLGGKVRPPQGGGVKTGVFATRSPNRPNALGLTLAKIEKVDRTAGTLHLSGIDVTDGTMVFDVKPYVSKADYPGPSSAAEWVDNPDFVPAEVEFTPSAAEDLKSIVEGGEMRFYGREELETVRRILIGIVSLDPRDLSRARGKFTAEAAARECYLTFDAVNLAFRPRSHMRGFEIFMVERASSSVR